MTVLASRVTAEEMPRPHPVVFSITLFTIAGTLTAPGCATAPDAVMQPTKLHKLRGSADAYAVSHDARARSAYFVRQGDAALLKFCAEPPPDVAANLEAERQVDASVDAALKYAAIDAALNGSGGSTTKASSEIADAATRTELVLFMRDSLYRICELHANGETKPGQAAAMFSDLLATAGMMSQRDNVGKLINAVEVVLEKAPQSEKAVAELLTTVQLLAVSNLNGGQLDPALRVAMTSNLMDKVTDAATKQAAVATILAARTRELESRKAQLLGLQAKRDAEADKKKKTALENSVAEIERQILSLEGEIRMLGGQPAPAR